MKNMQPYKSRSYYEEEARYNRDSAINSRRTAVGYAVFTAVTALVTTESVRELLHDINVHTIAASIGNVAITGLSGLNTMTHLHDTIDGFSAAKANENHASMLHPALSPEHAVQYRYGEAR